MRQPGDVHDAAFASSTESWPSIAACIVIVEDNPLNLELARVILEVHGYEVLPAGNAAECMDILAGCRPDLILMDLQLPGKDGLQLTRELRANPDTRDLALVAMTAYAMPEDAQRVAAAGCDGYVTKPIDSRMLAKQVAAFIARKHGMAGAGHETVDGDE